MANEAFKKLASFGRKKEPEKKSAPQIQPKAAKKEPAPKAQEPARKKEIPQTEIERKIERNMFKAMGRPLVLILFILAIISALGSIVVMYGPYGAYLQFDYNLILIISGGMLFLSFILLILVSVVGTGYLRVQRILIKLSFFISIILCGVMLFLKARDPAYLSIAASAMLLIFTRIFSRKKILDY